MSEQEYDRYHEYLEQKREELEYPDPCTCEWRELRYGRSCVRRLCAHCAEGIANAKRMRAALAAMRRPTVIVRVDDGRL